MDGTYERQISSLLSFLPKLPYHFKSGRECGTGWRRSGPARSLEMVRAGKCKVATARGGAQGPVGQIVFDLRSLLRMLYMSSVCYIYYGTVSSVDSINQTINQSNSL